MSRCPDFQTPLAGPLPDELSDPNLTPLPTHPGIKYVARALAVTCILALSCFACGALQENMKKEIVTEAKNEAASYDKFSCFCKDKTAEKSKSITEGQDTIDKPQ